MLRYRSRSREIALQLLFQRDLVPGAKRSSIERFVRERLEDPELETFALTLYDVTVANLREIDARLTHAADNWRLHRMATVDRNVLRLGTCELVQLTDAPSQVVLNEAIELARRFGSAESASFVNGVLDRVMREKAKERR